MKKTPKSAINLICEICDFTCSKKSDMDRHLLTRKHKNRTISNEKTPKNDIVEAKLFNCECGRSYKVRNSLWYHKKKCTKKTPEKLPEKKNFEKNFEKKDIIDQFQIMSQENMELKKMMADTQYQMIELLKKGTHNTNSNNTFNLQIFLNETCKDAMNITDFAESVKPQINDLKEMGQLGYIEGISNIIMKNLNALEINKRPMHCSDLNREIVYVKDENKWEKEDNRKEKLRKTIREVANKNIKLLAEYAEKYPDYKETETKRNEEYLQILMETMGGLGENIIEKDEEIIKNLVKEVAIETPLKN